MHPGYHLSSAKGLPPLAGIGFISPKPSARSYAAGKETRAPFGLSKREGFFVDCVTPELAALPEGWTDRLIPFCSRKTGGATGWCLELYDLAASKLAAGRKKDLDYVQALLSCGLINSRMLKGRLRTLPVAPASLQKIERVLRAFLAKAKGGFVPQKRK